MKIKVSIYRNNKADITGSNPAGSAMKQALAILCKCLFQL
nr:MAG TPA: Transcription factor TFIID (or TATA-binding protein, TBP) [Caudoviricetes sp.]